MDRGIQSSTMATIISAQNVFLQELPQIRQNTKDTVIACNNIVSACNDINTTLNSVTQISGSKKAVSTVILK